MVTVVRFSEVHWRSIKITLNDMSAYNGNCDNMRSGTFEWLLSCDRSVKCFSFATVKMAPLLARGSCL